MFLLLGVTFFHVQQSKGLAALTLQKQDVQQTKELVEQYQAEMALLQQQNELLMKFKEEQMQQLEKKLQDVVNTAADTLKKPSLKNLVASAAGPTAYRGTDDIDKEIQSLQAKMDEVEKTLEKYADALNAFPISGLLGVTLPVRLAGVVGVQVGLTFIQGLILLTPVVHRFTQLARV